MWVADKEILIGFNKFDEDDVSSGLASVTLSDAASCSVAISDEYIFDRDSWKAKTEMIHGVLPSPRYYFTPIPKR